MQDMSEQEFLRSYDPGRYPRPSVTADIVVMTLYKGTLAVLMIKRGGHPEKGKWALPGGFLQAGEESAEQAAYRELREETGIAETRLRQLATFSDPCRDPRTHVISIAYTALVPEGQMPLFTAGDDAADAALFRIGLSDGILTLHRDGQTLAGGDLAFDHGAIITCAVQRLRGRASYEPDAFELLPDDQSFTIFQLKRVHEAIFQRPLDAGNFRKWFTRGYVKPGKAVATGAHSTQAGRPAALYKLIQD